jgi:hypothetical protein
MMEDEKVAKLFLLAIIGEKVVELDFSPQERTIRIPKDKIKKKEEEKEKENANLKNISKKKLRKSKNRLRKSKN